MFTVFIADKEHTDAIQEENALFFEPFLGNKDLVFCVWNPKGQTLHEAVPGLLDAVGRRKEWRAVILNQDTEEHLRRRNPFDVVDCEQLAAVGRPLAQPETGEDWDSWENSWKAYYRTITPLKEQIYRQALELPLTKLATWLCFRPSDLILEEIPERKSAVDQALEALSDDEIKPNVRLEVQELEQYRRELRMKENLRRAFTGEKSLDFAYPSEVYCITERLTETGFFSPGSFWTVHSRTEYSAFVDRNMLFDKMRFMAVDVLPKEHINSRCDRLRFLYTALVFSVNHVPVGAMQARRLYVLDSENDETPLCTLATSYAKKLSATYEVIDAEMERIRSEIPGNLSDKDAAALFCASAEIPVSLENSADPAQLFAKMDYGLSADCPTDERAKWRHDYQQARKVLSAIDRQRRQSTQKSVDKLKLSCEVPKADISRLTVFQLDDVRAYTEAEEDKMIASVPPGASDFARYAEELEAQERSVTEVLRGRMPKRVVVALSAVCLGIYLVCLLPMLGGVLPTADALAAGLFVVATLGLMALILLVTLVCLRAEVLCAVGEFNSAMSRIWGEISDSMQKLSQYLSAVCNVRRGYRVLNYFGKHLDSYTRRLRIRRKHQEDIRKKRAYLMEFYSDFIGGSEFYDEAMICPYDYDFDQAVEYAYPAPFLAGDTRQIPFLEGGNLVTVPSSYVTRISVRMEEIYDA